MISESALVIEPLDDPRTEPVETEPARWCYPTPDTPFRLWRWEVDGTIGHTSTGRELLLCTDGGTSAMGSGDVAYLEPGEHVTVSGTATLFRVEEVHARDGEG